MHRTAVALALLLAPLAFAQTPPEAKSTVTADATETVRVKPDQVRIVVAARVKNPDAVTAADEAAEQAKKFAETVKGLKLKSAKVSVSPLQAAKVGDDNNGGVRVVGPGGVGGGPAAPKDVQATREVVVTVTDADFAALSEAVEKVQKEAYTAGLGGAKVNTGYNPFGTGDSDRIKVTYHRQDGADALTTEALGKATKKATARAEAIAGGLGMKLGPIVSAGEVEPPADTVSNATRIIYGSDNSEVTKDDLIDGELVRTVRVRVVYSVVTK